MRVVEDGLARGDRPQLQLTHPLAHAHELHPCIRHLDDDKAAVEPLHHCAHKPWSRRWQGTLLRNRVGHGPVQWRGGAIKGRSESRFAHDLRFTARADHDCGSRLESKRLVGGHLPNLPQAHEAGHIEE